MLEQVESEGMVLGREEVVKLRDLLTLVQLDQVSKELTLDNMLEAGLAVCVWTLDKVYKYSFTSSFNINVLIYIFQDIQLPRRMAALQVAYRTGFEQLF